MTRFRILGPLVAEQDGLTIPLGGALQRAVLAVLLLERGRSVSTERLIDALWPEGRPREPRAALHAHVSNLRHALAENGAPSVLRTVKTGYLADVGPEQLDASRFEERLRRAVVARESDGPPAALPHYEAALAEWRGPCLTDLVGAPLPPKLTVLLDERRRGAEEEHLDLLVTLGRLAAAIPELEAAVAADPLRERLQALLAIALYRAGRQGDALRVTSSAARALRERLGVEPGPELRDVEMRILAQDPDLAAPRRTPRSSHTTTIPRPAVLAPAHLVDVDGAITPLRRPTTIIGRDPENDVVLETPDVSRRHAKIVATVGGHLLVDLDSMNGTYVAGLEVRRRVLRHGDELAIGDQTLRFVVDDTGVRPAADPALD